ncbi:MAG: hypothetical protein H6716_20805 [Polyangiaceae bacterium]|nr:hypothetical protein [Polyangiaceae bacterium]
MLKTAIDPVALVEEAFDLLVGESPPVPRDEAIQLALQLIQSGDRLLPSVEDRTRDAAAGIVAFLRWHESVQDQYAKLVAGAADWLRGCEEGDLARDYNNALAKIAGILVPALPRRSAASWIDELLQLIFEGVAPSQPLSSFWPRDADPQHANPYRFVVSMRAAVQVMAGGGALPDVHEPAVKSAQKKMKAAARGYLEAVYKDDRTRGDRAGTATGLPRSAFVVRFYEVLREYLGHHDHIPDRDLLIAAMRMGESLGFEERRHQPEAEADERRADAMRRRVSRSRV